MKWVYVAVLISNFIYCNGQLPNPPTVQVGTSINAIPLPVNQTPPVVLPVVPPVPQSVLQTPADKSIVPLVPVALPPILANPISDVAAVVPQPVPNSIVVATMSPQPSCVCGVFLSGQFVKGSNQPPIGNPALLHEQTDHFQCNALGNKQCTNKCLDMLVKHLPNSPTIICGSMERDCYKERAYLWIQNCNGPWVNTNLSAGREYCCKDGVPYKCPLVA